MRPERLFDGLANMVAKAAGRPLAFAIACVSVLIWAISGPFLHLSDTWQLMVNTGSSIVTLLMVFLIQNTQARDSEAMHAKLDDIIKVLDQTDKQLIGIERLSDAQIERYRARTVLDDHPVTTLENGPKTTSNPAERPQEPGCL